MKGRILRLCGPGLWVVKVEDKTLTCMTNLEEKTIPGQFCEVAQLRNGDWLIVSVESS